MRHIQQKNQFATILLAMMLILGFSGMTFASDGKVDLNTGTVKELQQLPGIGKGLAKRIVEYRNANGPFKNVEELVKIKGIGKKTFARMKERLTVGSSAQVAASQ